MKYLSKTGDVTTEYELDFVKSKYIDDSLEVIVYATQKGKDDVIEYYFLTINLKTDTQLQMNEAFVDIDCPKEIIERLESNGSIMKTDKQVTIDNIIKIDYDTDVPQDFKDLVEMGIYTKEEAISKCYNKCVENGTYQVYKFRKEFVERMINVEEYEYVKQYGIRTSDIVEIRDKGYTYRNYKGWSGLTTSEYEDKFVEGAMPKISSRYQVMNIAKHGLHDAVLTLIQELSTKQVYIIGIEGLKKI